MLSIKNIADRTGLAGSDLTVNFPALFAMESIAHNGFELGIVNKVRDSTASMTTAWHKALDADKRTGTLAEMKLAKARAVIDALMAGEWTIRAESGPRVTDPVDREAKRLATETVNAMVKDWNAKSPNLTARETIAAIGLVVNLPFDQTPGSEMWEAQGLAIIAEAILGNMKNEKTIAKARENVAERETRVQNVSANVAALF